MGVSVRALDKFGNTIDFYLSATRNTKAAKRFLGKALNGLKDWELPEVLNTDKAPTYAAAIAELKAEGKCPDETRHRQVKYLNNVDVEQARRRSSRLVDHLAIVHQHVLVLRNQVLVPLVVEVGDILASLAYFSMRNSSPSTHARATLGTGSSSPGILSQSLSSMKVALFQGLTSPNSLSFS